MLSDQKQNIRASITALGRSLSEATMGDCSRSIALRLEQTELFQAANRIALYYSIGYEVQTHGMIEVWSPQKEIVLPAVSGEHIHFHPYTGNHHLKKGRFGIPEPVADTIVPPTHIDLLIVPGVAFDLTCNRLGRGKGYYDRYLSGFHQPVIGLCYDFQLLEHIPVMPHDKKMTCVITERTTVSPHHQSHPSRHAHSA